jgi:hypothetical protein
MSEDYKQVNERLNDFISRQQMQDFKQEELKNNQEKFSVEIQSSMYNMEQRINLRQGSLEAQMQAMSQQMTEIFNLLRNPRNPAGSDSANNNNEVPQQQSGTPEKPQPLAGKINSDSEPPTDTTRYYDGKQNSRRATLLDRANANEEENENYQKGVIQVITPDYTDFPKLETCTHPNQVIRWARKVSVKVLEQRTNLMVGTRLGKTVINAIVNDNLGLKSEDVMRMPFPQLFGLLCKLVRPKSELYAAKYLSEVEFPKMNGIEEYKNLYEYTRALVNNFMTYLDDFMEMIRICDYDGRGTLLPALTIRDEGLLGIFFKKIPNEYAYRQFAYAQKLYQQTTNNPTAKLEHKTFEFVADRLKQVMLMDVHQMESTQSAYDRAQSYSLNHETKPQKEYQKLKQYDQTRAKIFNNRVHFMSNEGELSAINPSGDQDEEDYGEAYDDVAFGEDDSENAEEFQSFVEQETPLDGDIQVHMIRSNQPRPGPSQGVLKSALKPGERHDYDRKQYALHGGNKQAYKPQKRDNSTLPCFAKFVFGNCKTEGCTYSHLPQVLDAALEKAKLRPWISSESK